MLVYVDSHIFLQGSQAGPLRKDPTQEYVPSTAGSYSHICHLCKFSFRRQISDYL